jgi:hypothetical protein
MKAATDTGDTVSVESECRFPYLYDASQRLSTIGILSLVRWPLHDRADGPTCSGRLRILCFTRRSAKYLAARGQWKEEQNHESPQVR